MLRDVALNKRTGVTPLLDVVQYQEGAVISRTLVKKPAGTVTAFAFDPARD